MLLGLRKEGLKARDPVELQVGFGRMKKGKQVAAQARESSFPRTWLGDVFGDANFDHETFRGVVKEEP
jgi:hypothetical protein